MKEANDKELSATQPDKTSTIGDAPVSEDKQVEKSDKNTLEENSQNESKNSVCNDAQTPQCGTRKSHRAPWRLDVVVILFSFFISQVVGSVICFWLGIIPPDASLLQSSETDTMLAAQEQQAKFIAITTLFAMIFCIGSLAIYSRCRGWHKPLSFRAPGWASPFRLLCGYILLWIFSIVAEPIAEQLPGNQDLLGSGGWLLISAIFLAPLFEEIVFRGYIVGTLRKAYGAIAAWLVSSLLFGLVHSIPSVILSASLSGLVLGFYYIRYRSLVMVIILHAMNNITACFFVSLGLNNFTLHQIIGNGRIYWVVYALCTSLAIIAIARMWQIVRELEKDKYTS